MTRSMNEQIVLIYCDSLESLTALIALLDARLGNDELSHDLREQYVAQKERCVSEMQRVNREIARLRAPPI